MNDFIPYTSAEFVSGVQIFPVINVWRVAGSNNFGQVMRLTW
jgi:hypothetical protein